MNFDWTSVQLSDRYSSSNHHKHFIQATSNMTPKSSTKSDHQTASEELALLPMQSLKAVSLDKQTSINDSNSSSL
jgi:hypothetical protein